MRELHCCNNFCAANAKQKYPWTLDPRQTLRDPANRAPTSLIYLKHPSHTTFTPPPNNQTILPTFKQSISPTNLPFQTPSSHLHQLTMDNIEQDAMKDMSGGGGNQDQSGSGGGQSSGMDKSIDQGTYFFCLFRPLLPSLPFPSLPLHTTPFHSHPSVRLLSCPSLSHHQNTKFHSISFPVSVLHQAKHHAHTRTRTHADACAQAWIR